VAQTGERKTRKDAWTERDDALLRVLYPSAKQREILDALPTRSKAAIKYRAYQLGVKRRETRHRRVYRGEDVLSVY
jgi:hypothetical protein